MESMSILKIQGSILLHTEVSQEPSVERQDLLDSVRSEGHRGRSHARKSIVSYLWSRPTVERCDLLTCKFI